MNQGRTASQKDALKASQAQRYHQLAVERGEALTLANQQRTQEQADALKAAQTQRYHELADERGQALTMANQQRTAEQHSDNQVAQLSDVIVTQETRDASQDTAISTAQTRADEALQDAASNKDAINDNKGEINKNKQNISKNAVSIRDIRSEQTAQGEYVQRNAVAINQNTTRINQNAADIQHNSQRIDRNSQRIDDTRQQLKRGLNNAAAMTGLHYHSNDAYAISAGTSNGDGAALAGGLSHSITEHTAATAQASTSMDGGWLASVGFSGDF